MKKMILLVLASCASLAAHKEAVKDVLLQELGTQWPALLSIKIAQAATAEDAVRAVRPLIPSSLWDSSMKRVVRRLLEDQFDQEVMQEREADSELEAASFEL